MMAELFGFQFGRKQKQAKEEVVSFVPKDHDDGAITLETGGFFGHYMDLDGQVKNDIQLVHKYREMSLHPECELAIDDIISAINKTLNTDFKLTEYDTKKIDSKFEKEAQRLLPNKNYIGFSITQGNIYRKKVQRKHFNSCLKHAKSTNAPKEPLKGSVHQLAHKWPAASMTRSHLMSNSRRSASLAARLPRQA